MAVLLGTGKKLIGFSMMVIGAMCTDTKLWSNRISKFISDVSLEIYLAHMMVFRGIEKLGLNRAIGNGWLQYIFTVIIVVAGTTTFAVTMQKIIELVEKKLLARKSKVCRI